MTTQKENQNVDNENEFIPDGWGVLLLALAVLILACLHLIGILQ